MMGIDMPHRGETMVQKLGEWKADRLRANRRILDEGDDLTTKRFFRLDGQAYEDGALPAKTKELLGLVASLVLRCDDCVTYHIVQCAELGVTEAEFEEAFAVGLIVGGSIVIPHLRRAYARVDEALAGHRQDDDEL
jgi:AhpD family alkylhydroperoxidase